MANNNKKNQNNVNQPRRKRNKKPVKRYSEEYSNRPNPYTGYSADGNYHPEAKIHTLEEASVSNNAEENTNQNTNIDKSEAEVKAVQPITEPADQSSKDGNIQPRSAENPTVRKSRHRKNNLNREAARKARQAKTEARKAAVDKIAKGVTAHSVSEQIIDDIASMSDVIEGLAKTEKAESARLEPINWDNLYNSTEADKKSEIKVSDTLNEKNTDNAANGVEKEEISVAKPVILGDDDVLPFDLMTAEDSKKSEQEEEQTDAIAETTEKNAEENQIPPLDPSDLIPVLDFDKPPQPVLDFTEPQDKESTEMAGSAVSEIDDPLKPVLDFAEPHTKEGVGTDSDSVAEDYDPLESILNLDVLQEPENFGKYDDSLPEIINTATIEEILNAVEQEKLEAAKSAPSISRSEDFSFGSDVIFDTSKSEGWDEIVQPPLEMPDENTELSSEETNVPDSIEEISKQLSETYLALENMSLEAEEETDKEISAEKEVFVEEESTVDDESAVEEELSVEEESTEFSEEASDNEVVMLDSSSSEDEETLDSEYVEVDNEAFDEDEPMRIAGDIFIESGSLETDDTSAYEVKSISDIISSDIDISEIDNELFAEADISAALDEISEDYDASSETEIAEEPVEENHEAVKEKIERLIEAAELAELVKRESEDNDLDVSEAGEKESSIGGKQDRENFSIDLNLEDSAETDENEEVVPLTPSEDEVKEYQPHDKSAEPDKSTVEDENVFESVLIVDDVDNSIDLEEFSTQDDTLFLHSKEEDECPTAIFKLPEGPIILPTDIDDGDFQEQWLDGEEDGDEMVSRSKRARRRISAFIGAVALILVLMIFVGVVKTAVMGINGLGSTSEKKAEYTAFIAPVVINDPDPFESIDTAENQMLLESSIWRVIEQTDAENYNYDATGKIVLSANDVATAGKKLFGNDVKLNMDVLSESDGNTLYYYDSIDNSFHISTGGIVGPAANITKIAQKSDYVSLIVGYSSQEDMNLTSSDDDDTECYKYMEYILAFNSDGSYYIQSIREYTEE